MKLTKTASGNKLKLSKKEWESIGRKAGWISVAEDDELRQWVDQELIDNFNDLLYMPDEDGILDLDADDSVICDGCSGQFSKNDLHPFGNKFMCRDCIKSLIRKKLKHNKNKDR